jgi:ethanolamine ammonia-lyase small subunit
MKIKTDLVWENSLNEKVKSEITEDDKLQTTKKCADSVIQGDVIKDISNVSSKNVISTNIKCAHKWVPHGKL